MLRYRGFPQGCVTGEVALLGFSPLTQGYVTTLRYIFWAWKVPGVESVEISCNWADFLDLAIWLHVNLRLHVVNISHGFQNFAGIAFGYM